MANSRTPRVGDTVRLARYEKGSEKDAHWQVTLVTEEGVLHLWHPDGKITARLEEIEVVPPKGLWSAIRQWWKRFREKNEKFNRERQDDSIW